MGDNSFLDVAWEGPVAVLTFGRPEVLNALDQDLLTRLIEALRTVGADPSARAIVLTGAGRAFMAGADVRLMASAPLPEFRRFVEDLQELTRVVRASSVPVIAAVNGVTVGAGCEIACACDTRLASRTAVLGFPETRIGLVVTNGARWLLPRLVGRGWTRRMLFTGETLEAVEAHRIGLVVGVCEPEEVVPMAIALGWRLAGSEPLALRLSRSLLDAAEESSLETALHHEVEAILSCVSEGQAREGLGAFLEKPEPSYRVAAGEGARS